MGKGYQAMQAQSPPRMSISKILMRPMSYRRLETDLAAEQRKTPN